MAILVQDIRYGIRTLLRNPGVTIVAALTLALGIGATTALFSMVENVLLRPLPYPQPDRLVQISNNYLPTVSSIGLSPGDFRDWQRQAKSFSAMGAYVSISQGFNLTGDGQSERIEASYASASFFPLLGIRPVFGRPFPPEEDRAGSAPSVLLSHRLWTSRFGADPAIVGRAIALDAERYTVIGVLPAGFHFLRWADVWLPLGQYNDDLNSHVHHDFDVIARLRPGVAVRQAQAEIDALNQHEERAFPDTHRHWGVVVARLERPEAQRLRATLLVLFGAVGLVLLIACANIMNLLLVRNAAREREIALRAAMGASSSRLVRQLLTESVVLALAGGALGLIAAVSATQTLLSLLPADLAGLRETHLNGWVLAFATALCLLAGILCGTLPALRALETDLNPVLKQGGKGTGALSGQGLHNGLVVAEIAMALVLLVGAGLLVRSFEHLIEINPGFQPDHLLTMNVPQIALTRAEANGWSQTQLLAFGAKQSREFQQLAEAIQALPGVQSAGGIDLLPPGRAEFRQASRFLIEGRPIPNTELRPVLQFRTVSLGYFRTMGIALLEGRSFTPDDWKLQNVVVINETMKRRYWPEGDALGKRINLCSLAPTPCWSTIIGIVADVRQFGLESVPTSDAYFTGSWTPYVVIRTASAPDALAGAVREAIYKVDPSLPVSQIMTMDDLLSDSVSARRFSSALVGLFALLALLLAAVGIYGVMSYVVRQRTHEIGIRMALGAKPEDVRKMVVGRGAKLAILGVALGWGGALALGRVFSTVLFDVKSSDPWTFATVALLLTAVALAACYVPARRAMRVDPMVALRYE
ncbi:MAG TPA: ABC transporter permease [Candidatus Cybelea sp.]|nr:ABC transporter permease [Candidatus Cybelea sp.]